MDLLHYSDKILEVFKDIKCKDFPEMIIRQRPGQVVQVMNQVRVRPSYDVEIDSFRKIFTSTPQVQGLSGTQVDRQQVCRLYFEHNTPSAVRDESCSAGQRRTPIP